MWKQAWSAAGLVSAAVALAACSSGGALTGTEQAYLDELDTITAELDATVEEIDQALSRSWPVPSVLFTTLEVADVAGTLSSIRAQVVELTPPPRFQADQDMYLRFLDEAVTYAGENMQAIQDRDLATFQLTVARLIATDSIAASGVSRPFCTVIARPQEVDWVCQGGESLPGGEYGANVHDQMKRFRISFSPLAASVGPPVAGEEEYKLLAVIQPEIEDTLARTRASLAELEPPDRFREDHARLLQYFDETLDVAKAITAASRAKDRMTLLAQYKRSGDVASAAGREFSEDFRPLVEVFFPPESG